MSILYGCDRCGRIFEDMSDVKGVMLCHEYDMLEGIGVLCEDCVGDLMKFMRCCEHGDGESYGDDGCFRR